MLVPRGGRAGRTTTVPKFFWAGLLAGAATALLTPVVTRWIARRGWIDRPGPRRVHKGRVPTGAGIAMVAAFWLAASLYVRPFGQWTGLFLGSLLIAAVGFWDDGANLKPWQKLLGQVAAAALLVAGGTRIEFVTNPLGGMVYIGWWGVPLTIFWVTALTNGMNFIDGLDGLTAGISAIAAVPLLVIAGQRGHDDVVLLTVCLLGVALGFLRYNFHPARVFMGDAGAMFLGFMLGAISVEGALKGAATMTLSIPLLTFGLPLFDTVCAVIRRRWNGRPIYEADAGHVHHRLLQLGFSHRRAVVFLYFVSALLGAVALLLQKVPVEMRPYMMLPVIAGLAVGGHRLRIFDDRPAMETTPSDVGEKGGGGPTPRSSPGASY